MRLTNFSDYALRVLMFAAERGDRLITIEETATLHGISRAHLMKIVNQLTRAGYLKAVRGRSGGLTLAKRPNKIRLGDVVRVTEPDFVLVECFGRAGWDIPVPISTGTTAGVPARSWSRDTWGSGTGSIVG